MPKAVRDIISAESGANDGLGYPFLYIAITLMQSTTHGRSINESLQHWIVTTWLYQIFLSVAIGIVIGFLAAKTLKFAHARQLVDHESFLAYGVGLAFFTLGVVGVLGSDDVLACFVAGNSLTWNDFYRVEKHEHDDTFQDGEPSRLLSRSGKGLSANRCGLCPLSVIDGLLDTATFIYIGALLPCASIPTLAFAPVVARLTPPLHRVRVLHRTPRPVAPRPLRHLHPPVPPHAGHDDASSLHSCTGRHERGRVRRMVRRQPNSFLVMRWSAG